MGAGSQDLETPGTFCPGASLPGAEGAGAETPIGTGLAKAVGPEAK